MRTMDRQKTKFKGSAAVLIVSAAVLLLLAVFAAAFGRGNDRQPQDALLQVGGAGAVRVSDGAEVLQTLTYTRCTHTVTRRVTAPVELYGKTLEEVQPLYPEWQITGFSATEVSMSRQPDLFCPAHLVLMTGDNGKLCVYRNKYGDALALEKQLDAEASAFPADVQAELKLGIGFGTEEALSGWLENMES